VLEVLAFMISTPPRQDDELLLIEQAGEPSLDQIGFAQSSNANHIADFSNKYLRWARFFPSTISILHARLHLISSSPHPSSISIWYAVNLGIPYLAVLGASTGVTIALLLTPYLPLDLPACTITSTTFLMAMTFTQAAHSVRSLHTSPSLKS